MTTSRRRRVPAQVLLVASLMGAVVALSGRIAPFLAQHRLLPQGAGWLMWPRGPAGYVRGAGAALAVVLLALLAANVFRRRSLTAAVGVVTLTSLVAGGGPSTLRTAELFTARRPQLEEIATLAALRSGAPGHDLPLPRHLAPAAVHGYVSTDGDGSVFVPQWAGLVDDAGGFWFTPGTTPQGRDMRGMICENPERLDGDWWACGMAAPTGKT